MRAARALNPEVKASPLAYRTVRGKVRFENGQPVPDVTVLAYGAGLDADELLGQATTDRRGTYYVAYARPQRSSLTDSDVALLVRVVNPLGVLLAASDTRFGATHDEKIDITIPAQRDVRLSQYEELLAELAGVSPDEQSKEEV